MAHIADPSALIVAVARGWHRRLPQHVERVLLSPAVVDALIESESIDALMAEGLERQLEVVELTQEDRALAVSFAATLAAAGVAHAAAAAEALALMGRRDLAAEALLSGDATVCALAREQGHQVEPLATLMGEADGAALPPAPPPPPAPPLRVDAAPALALDEESATLVALLLEQGVGTDADDVVRRAVRGLAAALLGDAGPA